MRCSDNNTAETVTEYGLPERVRSDQGGKNRLVALHMIRYRGDDRRMIVGSSVHNQRIERLWRDLHRCVIAVYYNIFYFLEYHGILEPTNEQHLFCLHYVYIPRINASLDTFATKMCSGVIVCLDSYDQSDVYWSMCIYLSSNITSL